MTLENLIGKGLQREPTSQALSATIGYKTMDYHE
jgi:hypothetical protein